MTMYASKTPRDLSHDPYPWAVYVWPHPPRINASMRYATKDEAERQAFGSYVHGFYPRPEFDHVQHNEPNPLLILWRETTDGDMRGWGAWLTLAAYDMIYDGLCTEAHKEHASRVLTCLANLSRIGDNT